MDLELLERQFRGARFGELVLRHLKGNDLRTTIGALQATIAELPPDAQPLVESWIDEINPQAFSEDFWRRDCADAFTEITRAAHTKLRSADVEPEVTVNYLPVRESTIDINNLKSTDPARRWHAQNEATEDAGLGPANSCGRRSRH